ARPRGRVDPARDRERRTADRRADPARGARPPRDPAPAWTIVESWKLDLPLLATRVATTHRMISRGAELALDARLLARSSMGNSRLHLVLTLTLAACAEPGGPDFDFPHDKDEVAADTGEGKADWPYDICEVNHWYGDGKCDWFCPHIDSDCSFAPLGP